jgi:hypothetical protein
MKDVQRDGTDYEFAVVLNLDHNGHYATAGKDRTGLFKGDPKPITEATGKMLIDWLNSGAKVVDEPKPVVVEPQAPVMKTDAEFVAYNVRISSATTEAELKAAFVDAYNNRHLMTESQNATLISAKDIVKAALAAPKVEPAKPTTSVAPSPPVTQDAF